jgi:hypothetical protein
LELVEKATPHCNLAFVKAMVDAGKVRTTRGALEGAAEVYLKLTVIDDVLIVSFKEL